MAMEQLHAGLEGLLGRVIGDFMTFMRQAGLSIPQTHALMYVYHSGGCQLSDVGALAGTSKAAASQLVERLVQQGLLERSEDPTDRRAKLVQLTPKGHQFVRQGIMANRCLMQLLASLPPEQLRTVHEALGYLAQAAAHMGDQHGTEWEEGHAQDAQPVAGREQAGDRRHHRRLGAPL